MRVSNETISCDVLPFPIICLDADMKVQFINRAGLALLDSNGLDSWVGRSCRDIFGAVNGETLESLVTLIAEGREACLDPEPCTGDERFAALSWGARRLAETDEASVALVGLDSRMMRGGAVAHHVPERRR